MRKANDLYDHALIERIREGDKSAFTVVFSTFYVDLVAFAMTFTKNQDISEEIVQGVFVKLWEEGKLLIIKTSLKSYLLKSVQNRCIDWLRHLKIRDKYNEAATDSLALIENDTENYLLRSELEFQIEKTLDKLPAEVSEVFKMNRFEGLKYNEIAERLDVSVRTVEVRMSKALLLLREHLKEYFK